MYSKSERESDAPQQKRPEKSVTGSDAPSQMELDVMAVYPKLTLEEVREFLKAV